MNCKWYVKSLVNTFLRPFGHELEDWSRRGSGTPEGMNPVQTALPDGAEAYLRPDNPRLLQLGEKYAAWNRSVMAPSVWTDVHLKPADIKYFRGDNAFVWQLRGQNMRVLSYILTAYYVRSIDSLGLLDTLVEDDCFGNLTCSVGNRTVSRDLLDSIMEIYFFGKAPRNIRSRYGERPRHRGGVWTAGVSRGERAAQYRLLFLHGRGRRLEFHLGILSSLPGAGGQSESRSPG